MEVSQRNDSLAPFNVLTIIWFLIQSEISCEQINKYLEGFFVVFFINVYAFAHLSVPLCLKIMITPWEITKQPHTLNKQDLSWVPGFKSAISPWTTLQYVRLLFQDSGGRHTITRASSFKRPPAICDSVSPCSLRVERPHCVPSLMRRATHRCIRIHANMAGIKS